MYKNLANILSEKKVTMKAFANFLNVSEKTVQNKMKGVTDFTLGEAMKTCEVICPEYKMDYVFEKQEVGLEVGLKDGLEAAGALAKAAM